MSGTHDASTVIATHRRRRMITCPQSWPAIVLMRIGTNSFPSLLRQCRSETTVSNRAARPPAPAPVPSQSTGLLGLRRRNRRSSFNQTARPGSAWSTAAWNTADPMLRPVNSPKTVDPLVTRYRSKSSRSGRCQMMTSSSSGSSLSGSSGTRLLPSQFARLERHASRGGHASTSASADTGPAVTAQRTHRE